MLYFSLAISANLLLLAHLAANRVRVVTPLFVTLYLGFALLVTVGLTLAGVLALQLYLQAGLLLGVLALAHRDRWNAWRFSRAALGVSLAAYVVPCLIALPELFAIEPESTRKPVVSLKDRLKPGSPRSAGDSLTEASRARLETLEGQVQEQLDRQEAGRRAKLEEFHRQAVDRFVNSQGFGVRRVLMSEAVEEAQEILALNQAYVFGGGADASERADPPVYGPVASPVPSKVEQTGLLDMHLGGVIDFANPTGFGVFESRRRVRGFESHWPGLGSKAPERWKVRGVRLVGLLLHDDPVVYKTNGMRRMGEWGNVPTLPLDAFETTALEALRRGEDISFGAEGDTLRMMGAIRCARQCVQCHEVERGALLGAFTYRMARALKPE